MTMTGGDHIMRSYLYFGLELEKMSVSPSFLCMI